jgi:hypothetical protein
MAEYNPLGSEKLNGDDKLKRILELTYYNTSNKKSSVKPELVESSIKGGIYGIVKENGSYYIKQGLNEQSLDYIGGMFMKNKNRFSSYSEAFKKLEFLRGQENLQEATKYVLKQSKPQQEAPMSQPSMDVPPTPPAAPTEAPPTPDAVPTPDAGMDTPPAPETGDEPTGDENSKESKRSDYMAEIQKFSGKLGQELRDQHQKMESDDIKYVLNMIISAVDLDKLHDKDREKIAKEFEPDMDDDSTETNPPAEPEPTSDSELGEGIDMLDEFINTDMDMTDYSNDSSNSIELYPHNPEMRRGGGQQMDTDEIDLSSYADIGEQDDYLDSAYEDRTHYDDHDMLGDEEDFDVDDNDGDEYPNPDKEDDIQEIDLDEIKNEINKHITSTLGKYFKS